MEKRDTKPGDWKNLNEEGGNLQAKKRQKRQWGPTIRVDRPRRVPEDGRTIMQRAQDLKENRNTIKGMTQKTSFAFESNEVLLKKAESVNLSFGNDTKKVSEILDNLKNKEKRDRENFVNSNPEVNLPDNLDIALSVEDFPLLNGLATDPLKDRAMDNAKTWVGVASESIRNNSECVKNDRCIFEY